MQIKNKITAKRKNRMLEVENDVENNWRANRINKNTMQPKR